MTQTSRSWGNPHRWSRLRASHPFDPSSVSRVALVISGRLARLQNPRPRPPSPWLLLSRRRGETDPRNEGKTDYRARIRLINQDKNKYNTPKYRFTTNKDIVAQIVSASIAGDLVLASAYSHELPKFGLEVGLTNYAAAYCTGLLLARRVLKRLEMDEEYQGNVEGALDGGLDIPHSDKRFAGFKKDDKQLDAEVHRKYIFGGHVAAYMRLTSEDLFAHWLRSLGNNHQTLIEDEPEKYNTHFSEYLKKGIGPDEMEALYKKVHAAIRADPSPSKSTKEEPKEHKRYNPKKLTYEERKANLVERLNALNSAAGGDDSDEDED
ncbi:hypothetical protein Taro_019504 [Colocasia esculenta]|uniref:Large ribosomal subunit protein uL18 C-terminal eukaryotes domain-containing protein n=1 Tax=Colocasia esculenta TaxID=4460 RepID=A0A843UL82_COLES|nr:hypothetical protein [Colocasia esculenta]